MDLVEEQLTKSKTIAVVGLSDNPERDSHRVSRYMRSQGYRIIPVNPMIQEWLGEKSYPDLKSVPGAHRHGGHLPAFGAGAAGGGRGHRGGPSTSGCRTGSSTRKQRPRPKPPASR